MSLEFLIAGAMLVSLTFYALLAGADYGGGVWDLFARGSRANEQRALIAHAMGPIWEANHVWLILVVVVLFTAFPVAFATIAAALHIPLTLLLIGIVLRGSAFTFRTYDSQRDSVQRRWSRVFSIASIITPVLLGVIVGALSSGTIHLENGTVASGFITSWLTPFPFAVGLSPWAIPLQVATGVFAVGALGALWRRKYRLARLCAAGQVILILWGWALAQYPYIVQPDITIQSAAAPPETLRLLLVALGAGALVLFPSFYYLFRVFKGQTAIAALTGGAASPSVEDKGSK